MDGSHHTKEDFAMVLQKAHKLYFGEELSKVLHNMRKSLEDPIFVSADNVQSMLISFREIQDYDAMIKLVEDLNANTAFKSACTPSVNHMYAFALNRRNQKGDRQLAEEVIKDILKEENHNSNALCLYGRLYKDMFVESEYTDIKSLDQAIYWYRKSFDANPNEYAGINLATLLVTKGNDFLTCPEIQNIASVVDSKVSMKNLETMNSYWDVATVFEISILSRDYHKAIQAAVRMFRLKPSIWCLKSTIANIKIINYSQSICNQDQSSEHMILNFWIKFLEAGTDKVEETCQMFMVLVSGESEVLIPSYAVLNMENKTCSIIKVCPGKLAYIHEFKYDADAIKSLRVDDHDDCSLLLHSHDKSQEICITFPSAHHSKRFHLQAQNILPDNLSKRK